MMNQISKSCLQPNSGIILELHWGTEVPRTQIREREEKEILHHYFSCMLFEQNYFSHNYLGKAIRSEQKNWKNNIKVLFDFKVPVDQNPSNKCLIRGFFLKTDCVQESLDFIGALQIPMFRELSPAHVPVSLHVHIDFHYLLETILSDEDRKVYWLIVFRFHSCSHRVLSIIKD